MLISKKNYSLLIGLLLNMTLMNISWTSEPCVQCERKMIQGSPTIPFNGLDKVIKAAGSLKAAQYFYCNEYKDKEQNELNQLMRDMRETSFGQDVFFLNAGCLPAFVGGIKSPMLHLTAESPCAKEKFPSIIYKYYITKSKDPEMWRKIVNAKNSDEETFLDFIETLAMQNHYNTPETRECINHIIEFSCKTGAHYSKYNKKCPSGL